MALDQTLERPDRAGGVTASGAMTAMTDAGLLGVLLLFIAAPTAGLFFFLGFGGSWIAGIAAAAVICVAVIWLAKSSSGLVGLVRVDVLLFSLVLL